MNPLKQMNEAMAYLEEHLLDEIDFGQMARIAGCTEYHFRRMFSYLAGVSLGRYILLRKLALAGDMLRQGSKVIDCAAMLGYDSSDAFSKAFQKLHGITPLEAKKPCAILKAYPPMTFRLTIQGGSKMNVRIVHKEPFRIVGFKKRITLQFEGVNPQMQSLNENLTPEHIATLKALCDTEPKGILSISANFAERTEEGTELDQYVGVATTKAAPAEYDALDVEASDWAVFSVSGSFPQAVQDTWARIYAEWLPSSEHQLTGGPELLWYDSPDLSRNDCKNEIWIPVKKNPACREAI
ncbi:AraC family transcriptional regulator [Eubacteriales bacterium OttesenSCG-928-A19]|nr:AraC family transcriptional regulator [Eubacteriales bacterium OttesenSCG-928-A19]